MVNNKLLKEYIEEFEEYYYLIKKNNNIEDLKKIYHRLKEISFVFYKENKLDKKYNNLIEIILDCENFFTNNYLINEKISLEKSNDSIKSIIYETRNYLNKFNRSKDINMFSFEGMCAYSSYKVKEICESKNIECYVLDIEPGYKEDINLFNGSNFHFFNIVKLNNNYYLIDCTYKQFFKVSKTFIERQGIINLSPPRVGTYMMMYDDRISLSKELLKNGYILLDDDTFKKYLDGFTISFRNGLYYENTLDFSYKTNYTVNDYINFFNGKDNQLNYEDKKMLGYQKVPLKDINFSFNKR